MASYTGIVLLDPVEMVTSENSQDKNSPGKVKMAPNLFINDTTITTTILQFSGFSYFLL